MNERLGRGGLTVRVDLAHEADFVLGPVKVRPARREIAGDGFQEVLEPRVMQVLVALARAQGQILSRDDLIECCWDGVVVGEDAINRCIGRLRRAAEAGGNAFTIETVPRVGYRLKTPENPAVEAPPERETESETVTDSTPAAPSAAAAEPPPAMPSRTSARVRAALVAAVGLVALMIVALAAWRLWPHSAGEPAASAVSVAVLPFANMSGDPAKEYFSEGFSEELLNVLSNDPRLRVVARTSSFVFKGKDNDIRSIGRALNVAAIVQGSVRESGNHVRIAAQLVSANDGFSIWSATYDRNLADILAMQNDLARAVAAALTRRLLPALPAAPPRRIDPAMYRLYLEGRRQLHLQSLDGSRNAVALFRTVTARQPDFADGFAALAHAAFVLSTFDPAHTTAHIATSGEAVQVALSLDPRNIEARVQREILELVAWDWQAAAADMRWLWNQNPNALPVLAGTRIYFNQMGFPDEANAVMRRAISLDPLASAESFILIRNLLHGEHYSEAIAAARALLVHQPNQARALGGLCVSFARTGEKDKARALERQLSQVSSEGVVPSDLEQCSFEIALADGNSAAARRIVESWETAFPDKLPYAADIAERYVALNDFDKASDWYERAYERREFGFFRTAYWNGAAKYRLTARWKALTQQPQFKEWQAEHDRLGADLAAHRWRS
jgi:TolB-like protein/DNA-binding winged helix-turn-helix (wHTH) protein